jgi:hypothetical protein
MQQKKPAARSDIGSITVPLFRTIENLLKEASYSIIHLPLYRIGKPWHELKGQCHEIFDFRFFSMNQFLQAPEYLIRALQFFFETGGKWKKSSLRKVLYILLGHLWVEELTWRLFFFSSSSGKGLSSLILFPSFAVGDIDTGGKFTSSVIDTSGNLPTVSTRPGVPVAKFAAGVVDLGVIDTGDVTWLANISANFWKNSKWP